MWSSPVWEVGIGSKDKNGKGDGNRMDKRGSRMGVNIKMLNIELDMRIGMELRMLRMW